MEFFDESFQRRAKWEADPDGVNDVLKAGAAKARAKGQEVLDRVRSACGLSSRG